MDETLGAMLTELSRAGSLYHPSKYWIEINRHHLDELSTHGLSRFKRSLNMRYFNWDVPGLLRHESWLLGSECLRGNWSPLTRSKEVAGTGAGRLRDRLQTFLYRSYVAALSDVVARGDRFHLLTRLEEPVLGDPLVVEYKGRRVSQDLCRSIHEFYSATEPLDISPDDSLRIVEIGAGYGRLGFVFLRAMRGSTYCVVDIPPALYVAQEYLRRVFPQERIFHFRPFSSFSEVREEFEAARIRFLMAHQIALLPSGCCDLAVNISSMDEMTRGQIDNYIRQIGRIASGGHFYSKQRTKSRSSETGFIEEGEYPIPSSWGVLYHRTHPVTRRFFEALYRVADDG